MISLLCFAAGALILWVFVFNTKNVNKATKAVTEKSGPIPSDTANTKTLEQVAIMQAIFGGAQRKSDYNSANGIGNDSKVRITD